MKKYPSLKTFETAKRIARSLRRPNRSVGLIDTEFAPSMMMQNILQTLKIFGVSGLGVLIASEEGNETDLIAKAIHLLSGRTNHPFIEFDCSAFESDKIRKMIFGSGPVEGPSRQSDWGACERASNGTLFLDHFSALPKGLRQQLVHAFEHQHFQPQGGNQGHIINCRFIITVYQPRTGRTAENDQELTLLHRICPLTINLPPLHQRREDIPFMIQKYIREFSKQASFPVKGISTPALETCLSYSWPGNTRELRKAMQYAVLRADEHSIQRHHLPPHILREWRPEDRPPVDSLDTLTGRRS